jgi:hypothetical protein
MIKFRNSEKIYDVKLDIISWRSIIQLSGDELPTEFSDFDVLNEEGTIVDYFEGFINVYDSGDGYVQLTNDNTTYYTYLVSDENDYITSIKITTEESDEYGYLYQSGQGKKYKMFTMDLVNEDGYPLYKIQSNKLVETSKKERQEYSKELLIQKIIDAKVAKINECSKICNEMIINGIDVEIDGVVEHFSCKEEDQMNIKELFDLSAQTNVPMFYHADNRNCKAYTADQIISIYSTACANKNHHTTYFNQIKQYINSLETLEEIEAVTYGQDLSGEYLETYKAAMAQAQVVLETLLAIRAKMLS